MRDAIEFDRGLAILTEYNADGFLGVGLDHYGETRAGAPPMEAFAPFGMMGRPADPDTADDGTPQKGALTLYGYDGDQGVAMCGPDPRLVELLPQIKKGESILYGQTGAFCRMHIDGAISLYTTDDTTPDGRPLYVRLSPTKGFEIQTPWARFSVGPNGIDGSHISGARFGFGAIGGLPGPLSSLGSYAMIEGGIASVAGGAVSLGSDGGAANEAATTALFAFLTELVAAIATITTMTPGASAMAPITAALPALQTALAKIGKVI